jgi:hypothetical protein
MQPGKQLLATRVLPPQLVMAFPSCSIRCPQLFYWSTPATVPIPVGVAAAAADTPPPAPAWPPQPQRLQPLDWLVTGLTCVLRLDDLNAIGGSSTHV